MVRIKYFCYFCTMMVCCGMESMLVSLMEKTDDNLKKELYYAANF